MSGLSTVLCKWHGEPLTLAAKPTTGTAHTPPSGVYSDDALYLDTMCVCERDGECGRKDLGTTDLVSI